MAKSWLPDAGFLPMNRGWHGWVTTPAVTPDAAGELAASANASLSFTNSQGTVEMIGLWINDIQFTFGLAGQDVQSKSRKSFFPHNFIAPVTQFSGQCPNQYEYNRLSQFVRQSQLNYVRGVNLNPQGDGLRLTVVDPTEDTDINRRQRGHHGGFDAYGYILNAPAGAERWVNAPTYTFEFTVTDVLDGKGGGFFGSALHDEISQRSQMESATGLFLKDPTQFVSAKNLKGDKPKRTTKEHKGRGLPPSDQLQANNPFLNPVPGPLVLETENGPIEIDTGTSLSDSNPSGG